MVEQGKLLVSLAYEVGNEKALKAHGTEFMEALKVWLKVCS